MAVTFRLSGHSIIPGSQMVEVLSDGEFVGAIFAGPGKSINVISAHIEEYKTAEDFPGEVHALDGIGSHPPIPLVNIRFDPSPYLILGDRIVKVKPKEAG